MIYDLWDDVDAETLARLQALGERAQREVDLWDRRWALMHETRAERDERLRRIYALPRP